MQNSPLSRTFPTQHIFCLLQKMQIFSLSPSKGRPHQLRCRVCARARTGPVEVPREATRRE